MLCGITMLGGQHAIAMATIGPDLLRRKATPPPLCPPALHRRMALPLNVCQVQHGGSRTAPQEYSVYNLIWKDYGMEKIPLPTEPEQENNGRWRKNNAGASLSMGGGFSTEGNYGISFNPFPPPLSHWRRYRDHTKAFKPVSSREQGL